jgi:hypothetical protein
MTVGELADRMTQSELQEWAAYETVTGPIGAERLDILFALQYVATFNSHPERKQKVRFRDMLPDWDAGHKQTEREQLAIVQEIAARYGGTITYGNAD